VLIYSPFAQNAFYNAFAPCMHADPRTLGAAPGETRWASTYFAFYEGHIGQLLRSLAQEHETLKRNEGHLDE
jgi:hypothetical protein